jgi:predicted Ser/Thr protein kinase
LIYFCGKGENKSKGDKMETNVINDQKFEDKLRDLFREVIEEYIDPDYGMIVKKSFKDALLKSLKEKKEGKLYNLDEVKADLGL